MTASSAGLPDPGALPVAVVTTLRPESRLIRFAWLPPVVFALAILIFWRLGAPMAHESAAALLLLNGVFLFGTSAFIAVLASRTFLGNGDAASLMLACAMVIWGCTSLLAVVMSGVGNITVLVHNMGFAISSLCHLLGALAGRRHLVFAAPGGALAGFMAGAFGVVLVILLGVANNWWPVVFVQGIGGTPLRGAVLTATAIMLVVAARLMAMQRGGAQPAFMRPYYLGLLMLALGAVGLMLVETTGTLFSWTVRTTQYVGGLYLLIGAIAGTREARRFQLPLHVELEQAQQARLVAERALAERARLLDLTQDAIMVRDADNRISYWNQGAAALYGWSATEARGRNPHELLRTEFPEPLQEILQQVRSEGRWAGELVQWARDGRRVTVASRWALDTEQRSGMLEINTDITASVQSREQLRETDRRKDEFIATLAHELRNPLAPLRNSVYLIKHAADNPQRVEQARAMMERQLTHMVRLIDDLLDVSRVSRGALELRLERVDLNTALRQAVETMQPIIDAAGQQLTLSVPDEPVWLQADTVRLTQAFGNLLNNASKYNAPQGGIWLTARREGDEVAVSVRDSGIGIPPGMQSRIFEMFAQVRHSQEHSQGGLGIGLTLTRRLIEMHGGSVQVHSEGGGRGSEFIVRLPLESGPGGH